MAKRLILSAVMLTALATLPTLAWAQDAASNRAADRANEKKWNKVPPEKRAYEGKKNGPAPKRDLTGIWDALAAGGIQAKGANEHPALIAGHPQDDIGGQDNENNTLHPIPYTEAGLAALRMNKPGVGVRAVGPGLVNDPVNGCDPPGFPRMELYDFREMQVAQTRTQVLMLHELDANYRIIWTDGRQLPKNAEKRWFGYSVGKWVDDYTFVVETNGLLEKTWLDHAGRPHTGDAQVEEQYHRVDSDTIELTVTITDPKYYSQSWQALSKFVLHRLPDDYDWIEYVCSPSDILDYNGDVGDPVSTPKK